jgi:hypothetical protein
MKKLSFLFLLFVSAQLFAQTKGITYQAIIYNPSGEVIPGVNNSTAPMANKNICLQFSIIDASSQLEYQETFTTTTDEFGMVNLVIGNGIQVGGSASNFDAITWSIDQKSLKVEVDVNGQCASFVSISLQKLEYVPYAFHANSAENVSGIIPIENGGTNATTVLGAKTNLGLENVDNTSDLNKPISIATQAGLDLKENTANKSTTTTLGTSDVLFPTQNAVKTYVDASSTALTTAINNEATIRAAADAVLTTNLANEATIRAAADATLTTNLATEVTNRINGDATLTTNLANEATTRATADAILTTNLATEVTNRINGDAALTTNLANEATTRAAADAILTTNLAAEVTDRTNADLLKENTVNKSTSTTLGTSNVLFPSQNAVKTYVDGNIATLTAANTALQATVTANAAAATAALNNEATIRANADATLTSNLATEVTDRTNADLLKENTANKSTSTTLGTSNVLFPSQNAVKTYVDGNIATVTAANTALQATVTANAAAATAALNNEATIRANADATLTTNLATEVTDRTNADLLKENTANKSTTTTLGTSDVLFPTQNAVKTYVDGSVTNVNSSNTAAIAAVQADVDANESAATNAISTLQNTVSTNATNTTASLALKENTANKSTTTTLGTSDVLFPTQNAVKTYVDGSVTNANSANTAAIAAVQADVDANESASNAADVVLQNNITTLGNTVTTNATNTTASLALKENTANKSTTTTLGTSDVLFPTQNAVKTYVDGSITNVNSANTAAIAAVQADVDANETTSNAADVVLQNNITTLGNTVTTNATNTTASLALKENTANKSTTTTLGTSDVLFPTQNAVKTYVDAQVASATIADATSSVKGKIQLTGDLGGTAAAPTVPGLALKAPLASPTFTGTVTSPIYASTPQALTDAATINWNPSNGLNASVTLGGNRTLSFASTPAVGSYGTLIVTQDATGNRTITLPSTSNKVLGSASTTTIALSTAANAKDILNFYYDGANCYWNIGQGYGTAAPAVITNLATGVSGTLPVANGGSGAATLTGYIKGNGTSAMTANATIPVADVTGTLPIANGGTGASSANNAFNALAPTQTSNSGKYLTTDGTNTSWGTVASTLPTTVNTSANYNIVMATASNVALVTGTGNGGTAATLNPYTGQMNVSGLTAQGYGITSPIYASTPQALTDAATINWNPSNGLNASVTLGGNRTLSFASTPAVGSYGTLIVTQDATGNRTITLPSTSNKVLGSASTTTIGLSTAANAKDILNFYYDGANCYWNIGQGYGTAAPAVITSLATGVSGTLPVANGGSGAATLTGYIKGNGTSAMTANATIPVADVTGAAPIASPTFTGTPAGPTATAGTNTTQLATTAFVTSALSTSGLPSQSGNNGKYLTTNGSSASWAASPGVPYSGATGAVNLGNYNLTVYGVKVGVGSGPDPYFLQYSTVVGKDALVSNTYGWQNNAFGYDAMNQNTTGNGNNAFGLSALRSNTSGNNNVAVGQAALNSSITGNMNTAVGASAAYHSLGSQVTSIGYESLMGQGTGTGNTALGWRAGFVNYGNNTYSTFLGNNATAQNGTTNATAIGNDAFVNTSNTIQLGNTSISNVKTSGTLTAGAVTYPNTHGTNGQVLSTTGSGTLTWVAPSASSLSGTVAVGNGGTGTTTLTGYVKGNGTSAMTANATIPVADVTGAAPIASPTFTGTPAGPTATAGTNTTQLATTAFVTSALSTSGLPAQSGNNGKFLTTNGSSASWASGVSGTGTLNYIPKFSSSSALANSSLSDDGTGLRIGNPNGTGGIYTGLSSYDNTRLMVSGGREYESIRMTFPGDPYNNELSFNWYSTAWRMRTERSSGDITDLSFWRTAGGTTTEAIRIKASGNFGIGVNPSQKLDVAGNVKFSGALMPNNSAGTSGQVLTSAGANAVPTWTTPASSGVPYTGATGAVNLGAYNLTVNELTIGKGNGSLSENTVLGKSAMANVSGNNNTSIGSQSMPNLTSGAGNTAIGSAAGYSLGTGSNNIIMGYNANMSGNPSNSIAIGTGIDVNTSNTIQLGNSSSTTLKTFAKITSGTVTYPNTHNSVAGQVLTTDASGIATWANPSVSIPLTSVMDAYSVTLNSTHNGYIFYSQHTANPSFPNNLPNGFSCTIVNYSGATFTSNSLTGMFMLSSASGSNTFTIAPGGTAIINVVNIPGLGLRYYVK